MGRKENPSAWPGPLAVLLAFAAAAVFGFLIMPISAGYSIRRLYDLPAYRSWQVLLVLQSTIWIFATTFVARAWRQTAHLFTLRVSFLAAVALLVILLTAPMIIQVVLGAAGSDSNLGESGVMSRWFLATIFGFATAGTAGTGILRLHAISRDWMWNVISPEDPIELHRELSSLLERHLFALAAILATAVIGTQAGRLAILDAGDPEPFLPSQVWQWGLYFSILLGVIYGSARATLRSVGARLRRSLLTGPDAPSEPEERRAREEDLDKILNLKRTFLEEIQSLVKVITPFVGAIASNLL